MKDLGHVAGLEEAIRECGVPLERTYVYWVGSRAFDDRRLALGQRQAEVVLAVRRPGGRFLLHTKGFYPQGIYRLLSGGIKPGEPLLEAVRREVREETGLHGRVERFVGVQHHRFCRGEQSVPFTSFVFVVAAEECSPTPRDSGEEISGFREVGLHELVSVAEQLEALPGDWADWGRFRASAHRLVAEVLGATEEAR